MKHFHDTNLNLHKHETNLTVSNPSATVVTISATKPKSRNQESAYLSSTNSTVKQNAEPKKKNKTNTFHSGDAKNKSACLRFTNPTPPDFTRIIYWKYFEMFLAVESSHCFINNGQNLHSGMKLLCKTRPSFKKLSGKIWGNPEVKEGIQLDFLKKILTT